MKKIIVMAVLALAMMAGMSFTYGEVCTWSLTVTYTVDECKKVQTNKRTTGNGTVAYDYVDECKSVTKQMPLNDIHASTAELAIEQAQKICNDRVSNPTITSCGFPRLTSGNCK
jgi:hypothetical protein